MLIALLAVLGVDLIVVVAALVAILARRRWVSHRPGAFAGAIRVASGEHDGFGSRWRRGYGRWVRDVFVWTKRPFLFRNELVAVDRLQAVRAAHDGEIKRMGNEPAVIELVAGDTVIQIAAHAQDRDLALGPCRDHALRDASGAATSDDPRRSRSDQTDRRLAGTAPTRGGADDQGLLARRGEGSREGGRER